MSQSRLGSLAEAFVNVAIGFCVSVAVGRFAYPAFGYEVTLTHNAGLTVVFTVTSMARSYLLRRFFNWLHETRKVSGMEG